MCVCSGGGGGGGGGGGIAEKRKKLTERRHGAESERYLGSLSEVFFLLRLLQNFDPRG